MNRLISFLCTVIWAAISAQAQDYKCLDEREPILFDGKSITYQGNHIMLGPKTFFVDGQLSDAAVARQPYVFNDFKKAASHFINGTLAEPMRVFIAPYVYWIDDPNDLEVKVGPNGEAPFGLVVKCENLHLYGLNSDARNTVLASWRGQAEGAIGNFTMLDFHGDGLVVKNLTLGNFCNVDLVYPLKPALNQQKRSPAITQAHVAYCHGDRIYAENVRFISRLNMNPLGGAKRILFNRCHLESTDDALTSTGVYLNCTLHFYGQLPFWNTDKHGAVFLNCDFTVAHNDSTQFFTKSMNQLAVIDCRYHTSRPVYAGWARNASDWLRCYQYGVTMNGTPYYIGAQKAYNTVPLDQLELLHAYRILKSNGDTLYNTFNLLRGNDDWDPLQVRTAVVEAGREVGVDYSNMPTSLLVTPQITHLRTGIDTLRLNATVARHAGYVVDSVAVTWKVQPGFERFVKLLPNGTACKVIPTNHSEETRHFSIMAYTASGLQGAAEITVAPSLVDPPILTVKPQISIRKDTATLNYQLALDGRNDQSLITWYRCRDRRGNQATAVAVSRMGRPEQQYHLTLADVGYYLMAKIEPKHQRSQHGTAVMAVSSSPIKKGQVDTRKVLETDFSHFVCDNQFDIRSGFWTVDGFKPADTEAFNWTIDKTKPFWTYGSGFNGAKGFGLLQVQKGARLLYTPVGTTHGDMAVTLTVDPTKLGGQGFGSPTAQYMDVCIKFDTRTLTGYALRIVRTTKYSDAVDFQLMRYHNGTTETLSSAVSANCYRTGCTIQLSARGDKLTAHVETTTRLRPHRDANVKQQVDLHATIAPNAYGGFGLQHTGSTGESTTMLHHLKIEWQ